MYEQSHMVHIYIIQTHECTHTHIEFNQWSISYFIIFGQQNIISGSKLYTQNYNSFLEKEKKKPKNPFFRG